MTLQIKGVQIAGFPAITIRNMLRGVVNLLDKPFVAARCKVSTQKAKEIIETLVAEGYLEFAERSKRLTAPYTPGKEKPRYRHVDCYKLTDKGEKLARGSAVSKMPRTKAEQIIDSLLRRVAEVNATADYLFRVPTVIVYGSYVRGEPLLSDVDIALELEGKWDASNTSQEEFLAITGKRVEAARTRGRSFSSFIEELDWPRREVLLHLKARTRGLSLHEIYDFLGMAKDANFAYKVLVGDANRIAERLAERERK